MNFLCDEGIERQIVEAPRSMGHKDFGELVFRQGRVHFGVVLVRLHGLAPLEKAAVMEAAVTERGTRWTLAASTPIRPRKSSWRLVPG